MIREVIITLTEVILTISFQLVVEYPDDASYTECGLVITDSNWFMDFTVRVRASIDNVIDSDVTVQLIASQTDIVDGTDATPVDIQTIEVTPINSLSFIVYKSIRIVLPIVE